MRHYNFRRLNRATLKRGTTPPATLPSWTTRLHPPDKDALRRRTQLLSQRATASARKLHLVPAAGPSRHVARCAGEIQRSPPSHNTSTAKADRKTAARPSSSALRLI